MKTNNRQSRQNGPGYMLSSRQMAEARRIVAATHGYNRRMGIKHAGIQLIQCGCGCGVFARNTPIDYGNLAAKVREKKEDLDFGYNIMVAY